MSLGRLASWGLGAAFVLVVGLAAADAVRKRDTAPARTSREPPERPRLVERLRETQVLGEFVLTAPGGCDRVTWVLPELTPVATDRGGCTRPDDRAAVRPDGGLTRTNELGVVLVPPGCDGTPACSEVLVAHDALLQAARRHPNAPARPIRVRVLVDGVAWLSNARVAVLLSVRISLGAGRPDLRGNQVIGFFEHGRLDEVASFFRGDLVGLRASPTGVYVAVAPGLVLRADGSELSLPRNLVTARAVVWSPDGRWLALALRGAVTLVSAASLERYDATGSGLRTVDLPLEARYLEWR
jgi:hypothetical protein